jgi:uncharacterized protein
MTEATPAPVPAAPLTEAEDKQWAGLAHLLGILGWVPALIIFLVFKDRGVRTRTEAKEALNWQITVAAVVIVLYIVYAILGGLYFALPSGPDVIVLLLQGLIGLVLFAVFVVNVIFSILGFTKVNAGGSYRYPFAIRLIK